MNYFKMSKMKLLFWALNAKQKRNDLTGDIQQIRKKKSNILFKFSKNWAWTRRGREGRVYKRNKYKYILYSLLHVKQPIHKQSSTAIGTATGVQYTAVVESYVYILSFDSLFISWSSRLRLSCFLYLNLSSK